MSNKKILIVEDDADVRMGLHVRLEANNYDIFLRWMFSPAWGKRASTSRT